MWWLLLCIFPVALATPVRICVPELLSSFCSQMQNDLPDTFQCETAPDILRCLQKVQNGDADITNVDPSALYLAGKFYDLRPITTELLDGGTVRSKGIALVRKGSDIQSAADLRNRSSCHTGFARTVGWNVPVGRLLESGLMQTDCKSGEIAEVSAFFNASCLPGPWSVDSEIDQQLKSKYSQLCSKCKDPVKCGADDAYAGYEGVMECLRDGAADVAFTKVAALRVYVKEHPEFADQAEILCFDGGRDSVLAEEPCVWGHRPTNAFVARATSAADEVDRFVRAILETQTLYSVPQSRNPGWLHKTFYSHPNATGIRRTEEDRSNYVKYLGDFLHSIRKPHRHCEGVRESEVSFCVTSDEELAECEEFSHAAEARGLWPDLKCVKTVSKLACMEALKENNADILVLDGGDVYKAGRYYGLKVIASELYNGSDATYYAVAVLRSASDVTKLDQLRGLRSCHTGIGRTAGWVMPVGALLTEGLLSNEDSACNHAQGVADFFSSGSCVPGANDTKSNPGRVRNEDLCRHCIGDDQGEHKCARDSKERFSGYAGAFRCLAEGKGDVAFVKHKTATEYTDGNGKEGWTKDLLSSDFQLLCDVGGTASVFEFERCNLGKVPSHQVVTGNLSEPHRLNIAGFLASVSQTMSSQASLFRLFGKGMKPDLLFKDSATGLKVLSADSDYQQTLGARFLDAVRAADMKNCAKLS